MEKIQLGQALRALDADLADEVAGGIEAKTENSTLLDDIFRATAKKYEEFAKFALAVEDGAILAGVEVDGVNEDEAYNAVTRCPLAYNIGVRAGINSLVIALTEYATIQEMRAQFPDIE